MLSLALQHQTTSEIMATILIVDDSIFSRRALRKTLSSEGYQVLEAINGRHGLEMIQEHQPDCVLLDMLMPELDGTEVLEELNEQGIEVPVIVVTADIQEHTQARCLELGAKAFLNKPPKNGQLQQAIQTILS